MVSKLLMLAVGVIIVVHGVKVDNFLIQMAGGFIIGFFGTKSN